MPASSASPDNRAKRMEKNQFRQRTAIGRLEIVNELGTIIKSGRWFLRGRLNLYKLCFPKKARPVLHEQHLEIFQALCKPD